VDSDSYAFPNPLVLALYWMMLSIGSLGLITLYQLTKSPTYSAAGNLRYKIFIRDPHPVTLYLFCHFPFFSISAPLFEFRNLSCLLPSCFQTLPRTIAPPFPANKMPRKPESDEDQVDLEEKLGLSRELQP
jgi:hypothetical protein